MVAMDLCHIPTVIFIAPYSPNKLHPIPTLPPFLPGLPSYPRTPYTTSAALPTTSSALTVPASTCPNPPNFAHTAIKHGS